MEIVYLNQVKENPKLSGFTNEPMSISKIEQLKKLKIRFEEIEPILNKTFKTSKELNSHLEKNKELYEEGKNLFDQIQQLEYELMTPEERAKEEEVLKLMKLKREGKM